MVTELINRKDDDQAYFACLAKHPAGYVLNAHQRPKSWYLVLHRATCHSISIKKKAQKVGCFTCGPFLKIVADSEPELRKWLRNRPEGFTDFSSVCGQCKKTH